MDPKKVCFFDIYCKKYSDSFGLPYLCGDGLSPFLQGIVFLVENELLRHTSEDIAQFLYKGEGLNKTAIGDYLGERFPLPKYIHNHFASSFCQHVKLIYRLLVPRDDFNIKVLQAFVDLHEFTDLNLVQALR